MNKTTFAAVAMLCLSPLAMAQSVSEHDGLLADASGRTLYTFDKDAGGKSNCNDGCAAIWPPFVAKEGAQAKDGYSVVTRDDGSKQWAFKSMPLYYFASDSKPGDVLGDGRNGVWHVVRVGTPVAKRKVSGTNPLYDY